MSLKGLHRFTAYEGDVRYIKNDAGLLVPDREPLWEELYENLIVDTGKQAYLDRLAGLGAVAAFTSLGVGTDSTAAAAGQIKLNPTVAGSVLIKAADGGFPSRAGFVLTIKSTFTTAEANFVWNEAGYFNGTVNGTSIMFNRVIIGPFTKTSAVSIAYTTTITQG
jgi:polyisoprenoid-binding protein YceI